MMSEAVKEVEPELRPYFTVYMPARVADWIKAEMSKGEASLIQGAGRADITKIVDELGWGRGVVYICKYQCYDHFAPIRKVIGATKKAMAVADRKGFWWRALSISPDGRNRQRKKRGGRRGRGGYESDGMSDASSVSSASSAGSASSSGSGGGRRGGLSKRFDPRRLNRGPLLISSQASSSLSVPKTIGRFTVSNEAWTNFCAREGGWGSFSHNRVHLNFDTIESREQYLRSHPSCDLGNGIVERWVRDGAKGGGGRPYQNRYY